MVVAHYNVPSGNLLHIAIDFFLFEIVSCPFKKNMVDISSSFFCKRLPSGNLT